MPEITGCWSAAVLFAGRKTNSRRTGQSRETKDETLYRYNQAAALYLAMGAFEYNKVEYLVENHTYDNPKWDFMRLLESASAVKTLRYYGFSRMMPENEAQQASYLEEVTLFLKGYLGLTEEEIAEIYGNISVKTELSEGIRRRLYEERGWGEEP